MGLYGFTLMLSDLFLVTRAFQNFDLAIIFRAFTSEYLKSYQELYVLLFLDSILFLLFSIICLCKRRFDRKRSKILRILLFLLQLSFYGYTVIKILIFYEWTNVKDKSSPRNLDRFDIATIVVLPIFHICGIFIWKLYFNSFQQQQQQQSNTTDDPERQPLLDQSARDSLNNEPTARTTVVDGDSR